MYVSNLGFQVTDEDLKSMFGKYGEVISARVITDRETGRSRGFAFVEMADQAAENAMRELDGTQADGRTIAISKAKPKSDSGSFQRNRGNRY